MVMAREGFRHVLVTEPDGSLRGIISERDLFSLQRVDCASSAPQSNRQTVSQRWFHSARNTRANA